MQIKETILNAIFGKKMPEKPVIRMCMMGPRGVGKTSVLTSVYNNMNRAITGTKMFIRPSVGTANILKRKTDELKGMFRANAKLEDAVLPGIAGDQEVSKFFFDFGIANDNVNMGLEIKDFPGEYLRDYPEEVKAYIEESSAILVAIDTPHLMEEGGKYNEAKNRPSLITAFFKERVSSLSDGKLVLLVPLKCEKYYNEGKIETVTEEVKRAYKELIDFLQDQHNANGMRGKHACVITPILTLGEVEFDSFETENGAVKEIVKEDGMRIPASPRYKYQKPGAKYAPKYCEQPVYYLLSFVSKLYQNMENEVENTGLLRKLKKWLNQLPQIKVLSVEMTKLGGKKLENVDGFTVLFGRGKV